ncbi:Rieske iron-sulfur protein [Parazoarcus communis]|jgi:Rieske Fe-S protein|uniref:Rieske iron-sulfur protein n=1 Tax=Parazoarcus communis TaxID=41977 RepID=A0A2U8H1L3_9RHOO|nr:Rieske (2Fe-2S) protein [Parazoarcus communis]AWI79510.1 Rieske iron-sulfur protein [Parazoarcus communis]
MEHGQKDGTASCGAMCNKTRRTALKLCAGAVVGWVTAPRNNAMADTPDSDQLQIGDRLVVADAETGAHKPLALSELTVGGKPVIAYPFDAASGTIRDGSRLNRVLLLRLDPSSLDERTRAMSADGVLAYSAVCTHQGCDLAEYNPTENVLFCFCHFSTFRPTHRGEVVSGPAPRNLPMLPLRLEGGQLVVADAFTSRPGATL